MSAKRVLSLEEANDTVRRLALQGVKVFDFRGKTSDEQVQLLETIRADIKTLLVAHGLDEHFPLTFVAGSGKTSDTKVLEEAASIGETLEAVINGGGQYSVMGATAKAAKLAIGVTCEAVMPFETPDERYKILIVADGEGLKGLEKRLKITRALTIREIAIHGGLGTIEEVLGGLKVRETLALLIPHWSPLIETFKKMHQSGYVDTQTLDRIHPISPSGTPVGKLSDDIIEQKYAPDFKQSVTRITEETKHQLEMRGQGAVHLVGGATHVNDAIKRHNFFVFPPGNIDTMHQAILLMCEKRLEKILKDKAPNPGILEKPIILLNIDGFYDEFMEQWRELERKGFLSEKLCELMTEVKIPANAPLEEIQNIIATKVPNTLSPAIINATAPYAKVARV